MKKSAKEWFQYLTKEERYNINLLIESNSRNKTEFIFDTISEAITGVGTCRDVNYKLLKLIEIDHKPTNSQDYFQIIFTKYTKYTEDEILVLNKPNLKETVKEVLCTLSK